MSSPVCPLSFKRLQAAACSRASLFKAGLGFCARAQVFNQCVDGTLIASCAEEALAFVTQSRISSRKHARTTFERLMTTPAAREMGGFNIEHAKAAAACVDLALERSELAQATDQRRGLYLLMGDTTQPLGRGGRAVSGPHCCGGIHGVVVDAAKQSVRQGSSCSLSGVDGCPRPDIAPGRSQVPRAGWEDGRSCVDSRHPRAVHAARGCGAAQQNSAWHRVSRSHRYAVRISLGRLLTAV